MNLNITLSQTNTNRQSEPKHDNAKKPLHVCQVLFKFIELVTVKKAGFTSTIINMPYVKS